MTYVEAASTTASKSAVVLCETAGEDLFAVGGGYLVTGAGDGVVVSENRPNGLAGEVPAGWRVAAAYAGSGTSGSWGITAYAICANVADAT